MYTQETQNNATLKLDTLTDVIVVTVDGSRYGLTLEGIPVIGLRINVGESMQVVWGRSNHELRNRVIGQIIQQLEIFPHTFDINDIAQKLEAQVPKDITDFFKPRTTRASTLQDMFVELASTPKAVKHSDINTLPRFGKANPNLFASYADDED